MTLDSPAEPIRRLESLDLLRALAILLVFCSHYDDFGSSTIFPSIAQYGWAGVDLFFVLSGYLIANQLLKPVTMGQLPSYGEFYLRRSFRILPSYFAVLLVYLLVPSWQEHDYMPPLWKFLTFTMNFGLNIEHGAAFSHAWSLCVEEHFYLLLPIFVIVFAQAKAKRWVVPLLIGVALAGIAIRLGSWLYFISPMEHHGTPYYKMIYYPSYCRLDGLLAGVTIALISRFRPTLWRKLTKKGNWISLMGLALLAAACVVCAHRTSFMASTFGFPMIALGFAGFVIAGLSPQSFLSKIRVPGAPTMAVLAFTFYLTHKEVIHLVHSRFAANGWNRDGIVALGVTFAMCLGVSGLLHLLVERPFLNLRDRLRISPFRLSIVGAPTIQ